MKPLDYITWTIGDIAKDFGGKDPGQGRSLGDKRAYLLFITVLCTTLAIGFSFAFWPVGVAFGLIAARKLWIYCTIAG
jgi:hypothetical protein